VQKQPVIPYELMAFQTFILILHPTFRGGKNHYTKTSSEAKMSPQQNFIAGKTFLSEKVEEDSDDQYTQPEEIDSGVQNSNLLLTSDHQYTDPYERPSWGGMVVYLNTIMKWYGVTP
jgi:hypothetical protein